MSIGDDTFSLSSYRFNFKSATGEQTSMNSVAAQISTKKIENVVNNRFLNVFILIKWDQ